MTRAAQRIKTLLRLDSFDGYNGLIKPIERTVFERDNLRMSHSKIGEALQIDSANHTDIVVAIERLMLTCENQRELLARPDTTQPQLSEIRYVLHGDVQQCSVLYSDDTTTLLRLDEGDVMCETDTIEWSDSVTYRCQELLKSAAVKLSVPVTLSPIKLFAQLVRDERILLNDNGDAALKANPNAETLEAIGKVFVEVLGSKEIEQPCDECSHIFDAQSMTCPVCNTIRSSEWATTSSPTPLR